MISPWYQRARHHRRLRRPRVTLAADHATVGNGHALTVSSLTNETTNNLGKNNVDDGVINILSTVSKT